MYCVYPHGIFRIDAWNIFENEFNFLDEMKTALVITTLVLKETAQDTDKSSCATKMKKLITFLCISILQHKYHPERAHHPFTPMVLQRLRL